ncbi:hypothetical protein FA13DRAFT_1798717 [Coprinellus micaceus]|uniref:F-box domain-containing protein n=1 Tax=Coprinellus micaceus TaxID=71717 RepID=A0A4Y7SL69_COPMI|nr:hypothetical protein FA13DRAFT_1798717 [Coprinellus micaceus]
MPLSPSMWEPVLCRRRRMGFLRIDIAETYGGTLAKVLLNLEAPSLRHCMVTYMGPETVRLTLEGSLDGTLFADHFPRLRTLELTNCYIPPAYYRLSDLSLLVLQYLGPPGGQDPTLTIKDLQSAQFKSLRRLVIWDCFSEDELSARLPIDPVEFPALEQLVVAIPYQACERLFESLLYPGECTISLVVCFPGLAQMAHAEEAAVSGCSFIPLEDFEMCRVVLRDPRSPSIRLTRSSGRGHITVRFRLHDLTFPDPTDVNTLMHAINRLSLASIFPAVHPFDAFSIHLWDALAMALQRHLARITTLHVVFKHNEELDSCIVPSYPISLFRLMPMVENAIFEPPTVYTNRPFFHAAGASFPNLKRITVNLHHNLNNRILSQGKVALAEFFNTRVTHGLAIDEAAFVVSPRLAKRFGFSANRESYQKMVAVYADNFPRSVVRGYIEK